MVAVGVIEGTWVAVGVWGTVVPCKDDTVAVVEGCGGAVSVVSGAASTVPLQAVKKMDTAKIMILNCFM